MATRVKAAACLTICGVSVAMLAIAPVHAQRSPLISQSQLDIHSQLDIQAQLNTTDESDPEFSDAESSLEPPLPQEELEVFATAFAQMVELREDAKSDLAEAITSEDLTPEQFLDIRDGNREGVGPEELVRFARAEGEVNRVRDNLEQDMQEVVQEEGMTVARFHEIFSAVEETPELQARLQQVWEERL